MTNKIKENAIKIADLYKFDLIEHIKLKNEYNKTRGYLYGKKFQGVDMMTTQNAIDIKKAILLLSDFTGLESQDGVGFLLTD